MEHEFGMKELYSVVLKTPFPLHINGRDFAAGEVVAAFDKITLALINERSAHVVARGGFDNRDLVTWTTTQEIQLRFTQGIFSKVQFALLSNSKLLEIQENQVIPIFKREVLESSEEGVVELSEEPFGEVFLYKEEDGLRIQNYTQTENKVFNINEPFVSVVVDYSYQYSGGGSQITIGKRLVESYLELEGKTRVKDDNTGHTKTGIIKIPKLKLMSNLSMRLGRDANPMMADFQAIGVPTGKREDSRVMEIIFLNDDIDSDF